MSIRSWRLTGLVLFGASVALMVRADLSQLGRLAAVLAPLRVGA